MFLIGNAHPHWERECDSHGCISLLGAWFTYGVPTHEKFLSLGLTPYGAASCKTTDAIISFLFKNSFFFSLVSGSFQVATKVATYF